MEKKSLCTRNTPSRTAPRPPPPSRRTYAKRFPTDSPDHTSSPLGDHRRSRFSLAKPTPDCNIDTTMTTRLPISDLLRKTINESGVPFLTLEQQTGVLRQSLMRFARGETSIHLDSADEVARYFGLELRPVAKAKKVAKPAKCQANPQQGAE